MKINWSDLEAAAKAQAENAYAPYSGYRLGAALLGADGKVYLGSNVENASYGLTQCAERCAICTAVAAGCREFVAMALYYDGDRILTPCGACRQVMAEFARDRKVRIRMQCKLPGKVKSMTLGQLLPAGFFASDLKTHS